MLSTAVGLLLCASALAMGSAAAQPIPTPPPGPTQPTSTSDELADMVMDVIEHGGIPATTPVPSPAP
jgi:hypothetical protein